MGAPWFNLDHKRWVSSNWNALDLQVAQLDFSEIGKRDSRGWRSRCLRAQIPNQDTGRKSSTSTERFAAPPDFVQKQTLGRTPLASAPRSKQAAWKSLCDVQSHRRAGEDRKRRWRRRGATQWKPKEWAQKKKKNNCSAAALRHDFQEELLVDFHREG